MIRYIVIAAMNLLVAGTIAGSAAHALVRGCNMDGTCTGPSSAFTWALALGLGAICVAGTAVLVRYARTSRQIGRASIAFEAARSSPDDTAGASPEEETMLCRLARLSRAGEPAPADVPAQSPAPTMQPPVAVPDLHLVVSEGARVPTPMPPTFHKRAFTDRLDWLLDPTSGKAARVREDTGFPWCVAGIDHAVDGLAQFDEFLADTDVPAECAAWRRIAAAMPRGDALGEGDAHAFAGWFNASLRLVGRGGAAMIDDAMRALEQEAVHDRAVGRALPAEFWQIDALPQAVARFA